MSDLGPRYEHKEVEERIYRIWEESGYFDPDNLPAAGAEPRRRHADERRKGQRRSASSPRKSAFCIIMPPPNANGALHMGHAVFVTLEDIMTRFWRMRGRRALWLPGADHAGFETQVVFDKKLEKEGRNRFTIDRETLWKEIWDFTQENKKVMENQLRRLGASCDWSREMFTLDKKVIEEVNATFKKMYDDDLIYRDLRVVNWCPKHKTALSDLEAKYVERKDPLYYIKYGPLTLATVRPETKFGDTALAVNPKDKRYQKYFGEEIEAKGLLGSLKFKVIADEAVDPHFGTGVVKVTPAHDATDFDIWTRHKGEIPGPKIIIDENGRLTGETGPFAGLEVTEARAKVAEAMREAGILEKVEPDYIHQIATCYRCGNTLEPLPKPQWFVKMAPLAKPALAAVKQKKIAFYPEHSRKVFVHWLTNIRDWNISRQIIWGIRIPAWFCTPTRKIPKMGFYEGIVPQVLKGKSRTYRLNDHSFKVGDLVAFENSRTKTLFGHAIIEKIEKKKIKDIKLPDPIHGGGYKTLKELLKAFRRHYPPERVITGDTKTLIYDFRFMPLSKENPSGGCNHIVIGERRPSSCPNCGKTNLEQDPDVFDTWFSSGQWPYITLGFSDKKQEVGRDYKEFYPTDVMETAADILFFWVARMVMFGLYRTGRIPFRAVYLHGLVRDKDRQKMSKSKGNVIDPLGVADTYGSDAVRTALVAGNTPGRDTAISEDKIRGYRNFATKVWNIARFILMNRPTDSRGTKRGPARKIELTAADRRHIAQAKKVKARVAKHIEKFEFHLAAEVAYHYIWHTFADKIVESAKPRLRSPSSGGQARHNKKDGAAAYYMLQTILVECLTMLHPFMPFITEEIYQKLLPAEARAKEGRPGEMLMVKHW